MLYYCIVYVHICICSEFVCFTYMILCDIVFVLVVSICASDFMSIVSGSARPRVSIMLSTAVLQCSWLTSTLGAGSEGLIAVEGHRLVGGLFIYVHLVEGPLCISIFAICSGWFF